MKGNVIMKDLHEHTHENCPFCGKSLCAGLIAETISGGPYSKDDIQSMYGDTRCYSKRVGVEVPGKFDGVSYWHYPCCGNTADRWTGEKVTLPSLQGRD